MSWLEKITGSLADKREYRRYKERVRALPEPYRRTVVALERYVMTAGGIADGETLVIMLDELATLFEGAAADARTVGDIVGDDIVEFAEDFLAAYKDASWIAKERARLRRDAARALGEGS